MQWIFDGGLRFNTKGEPEWFHICLTILIIGESITLARYTQKYLFFWKFEEMEWDITLD